MIHLHSVQQSVEDDYHDVLRSIKNKWLVQTDHETQKIVAQLRSQPDPTVPPAPRHRSCQVMSKRDRLDALSQLFDTLCDVACTSDESFDKAAHGINLLTEQLLLPARSSPDGPDAAGPSGIHGGQDHSGPDQPSVDESSVSKTDDASLHKVLGVSWTPKSKPTEEAFADAEWWRKLLGAPIAVKFGKQRSGGWAIGRIMAVQVSETDLMELRPSEARVEEQEPMSPTPSSSPPPMEETNDDDHDEDNQDSHSEQDSDCDSLDNSVHRMQKGQVYVIFPGDNSFEILQLSLKTYSTTAKAPKLTWMLLQEAELGIDKNAPVNAPLPVGKRGRRRTTRYTPAAGPLGPPRRKSKG